MAKKAAVKKEEKVESPLEALQKKVETQAQEIEDLKTAIAGIRNNVDQVVSTFQRKFPYG